MSLPFLVGFFLGMEWLVRLVGRLAETRQQLEAELAHRSQLEDELSEALARAEAASKAKSDFLATISHEVRTPLSGVLGFADALLLKDYDDHTQNMHRLIRQSGLNLLSLLNEIPDVSKIEAGRLDLETREFDLARVIEGISAFWDSQFDGNVEFGMDVQPDLETHLVGDEMRLRQAVDNLVSNAKKFTDRGRVTVSISGEWEGKIYALRIAVKDTGIGLTSSEQARIFEPFTHADQSVGREHDGTGLGLTICRSLARAMAGDIEVESAPDHGSTFTLTLRLATPDAQALAATGS